MHRFMKHLAVTASPGSIDEKQNHKSEGALCIQPLILELLVTWLADCSNAVNCLLESPAHLTYLLSLISNPQAGTAVQGLAAIVLGKCVFYNRSNETKRDAFAVVDALSQKVGLKAFFLKFDELRKFLSHLSAVGQHNQLLARSNAASMAEGEEVDSDGLNKKHEHPILLEIFDSAFIQYFDKLEAEIRESILGIYSNTKNKVAVLPAELEQNDKETDADYIKRLKAFVASQCNEMQDLLCRNATLAEELVGTGGATPSQGPSSSKERVLNESLRQDLQEARRRIEILMAEKAKFEDEANNYRNLAAKLESDLKSLSDAYNSLEQFNFRLESEVKVLRKGENVQYPDAESIKAEAREAAEKESEAELNDLLICLGQEQSKVEKLSARLRELGEDVDSLLEGLGDEAGLEEDNDQEDEEK